jgi:hypothetical protein
MVPPDIRILPQPGEIGEHEPPPGSPPARMPKAGIQRVRIRPPAQGGNWDGRERDLKRPTAAFSFAATVIFAVAAAIIAWAHSHFLRDDFAGFYIALHEPLAAAMMTPIDVHFVPLHRFVNHVIYGVAPMSFGVAVALLFAVHAVTLVLMYALLQRLKDTPSNAVLLFFYGTNVQLGVLFVWWTSGLHRLPYIALAVATLYHFVVWRSERRGANLGWATFCFVAALGFYSKAALIPLTLIGLEIALLRETTRGDLLRNLRVVAAFCVVSALQIGLARSLVDSRFSGLHFDPGFLLAFGARSFATLSEAIFGFDYLPIAAPVNALFFGFWAVFIAYTIYRRPWNAVVWSVGIGLLAAQVGVIGVSHRTATYGLSTAGTDRYYFELIHIVALFVALVLRDLPPRVARETAGSRQRRRLGIAFGYTALVLMAAFSFARFTWLVDSPRYQRHREARVFNLNLIRGLARIEESPDRSVALVDGLAPAYLTGKTAAHIRRYSDLVPIFDPEVSFDPKTARLFRVTDTGMFERVKRPQERSAR